MNQKGPQEIRLVRHGKSADMAGPPAGAAADSLVTSRVDWRLREKKCGMLDHPTTHGSAQHA